MMDVQKMLENCFSITGKEILPRSCYGMLVNITTLGRDDIFRCNESEPYPRVEHFFSSYYTPCAAVEINILRWVLPPLMMLCTAGNVLALLIYRLSYFDGSSSVHFLRAKALTNVIFVNVRLFEVVHAWTDPASESFEPFYWHSRPYIMTISNISGTMSTWLTLLVTIETVMCISMPFTFRQYCTVKTTWMMLSVALFFSFCLNLAYVPTTQILTAAQIYLWTPKAGEPCWHYTLSFLSTGSQKYAVIQAALYWTQMFAVIMLPTIAMLLCTLIIIRQFSLKAMGEQFSQRRKCVIRMTVSTTLSHLLLEGPATLTYSAAAIMGNDAGEHPILCVLNHALNLASVVNATIPFFVFLLCSEQFRHMTAVYLKALLVRDKDRRAQVLSQAGVRYSARIPNSSRLGPERSQIIETKLMNSTNL